MKKISLILAIILCINVFTGCAASCVKSVNGFFFGVQKADDESNYETIKKVEDTCRSMISSYESDKLTYEQYKDSDDKEKQGWAEQAKMRANKTASSYNNYILENSFVWEDNVPEDIKKELEYLD